MEIKDIQITKKDEKELLIVTLSETLGSECQLVLLERCRPGIWVDHRRRYSFEKQEGKSYAVDLNQILEKDIHYNELVVLDIKTKNSEDGKLSSVKSAMSEEKFSERKTATFRVDGKSVWEFYKNNSDAVSLKLKLYNSRKLFTQFKLNTESSIVFAIEKFESEAQYYFARQSGESIYDFDAKIPLVSKQNGTFVLNKKDLLSQIKKEGENWYLIEEANNRITILSCANIYETLQDINEVYSLEFLIENGKLKCVVKEKTNLCEKINIWVIGSCYSRLVFRSLDFYNKDYKRIYNPITTIYHTSIPSMISDKIPYDEECLVGSHQQELNRYAKDNFDKGIFEKLAKEKPDYIIMDNYSSFANDLIETDSGAYIDKNFYLSDCKALQEINVKNVYSNVSDEFFDIYKDSLKIFREKLEKIMPLSNVILIRANPALQKSENGVLTDWPEAQTIKARRYYWNRIDNYFIANMPGIKVIDLRNDDKYFSENSPIQQFQSNHLNSVFYQDAFARITEAILLDKIRNN